MKTVYINGRFLTQSITGVQRYAIEIVKGLDEYLDKNINDRKKYKFIVVAPKNIKQKLIFNNITIKRIGLLKGHLWEQIELPLYVKNKFLLNLCNCAPLIKQNQIVTIHDAAIVAVPEAYSFQFKLWYRLIYTILGHRLKKIITVSNFSKKELNKYFKINLDKFYVTYNSINYIKKINSDIEILNKFDINKGEYILGVSSLNPSKNFRLIIDTAVQMPKSKFIIAGGTNKNVFRSMGVNVPENLKFIGYVSDEELVCLYKYAYCFVYPSIYEGFGIPPLEAMINKCPVIVSNIEVFKEIYENNVLYCENTVESLKDKLNNCNKLKQYKTFYENNLENIIERYSGKESIRLIMHIIEKYT